MKTLCLKWCPGADAAVTHVCAHDNLHFHDLKHCPRRRPLLPADPSSREIVIRDHTHAESMHQPLQLLFSLLERTNLGRSTETTSGIARYIPVGGIAPIILHNRAELGESTPHWRSLGTFHTRADNLTLITRAC